MVLATANNGEYRTTEKEKKESLQTRSGKLLRDAEDSKRKPVTGKISQSWDSFPGGQVLHLRVGKTSSRNAERAEV